jgi:hypothetical protein
VSAKQITRSRMIAVGWASVREFHQNQGLAVEPERLGTHP